MLRGGVGSGAHDIPRFPAPCPFLSMLPASAGAWLDILAEAGNSAHIMNIAELLELPTLRKHCRGHPSVAVVGSGGKTTLVWALARHFRHERVLVSTTVKMWMPKAADHDVFLDEPAFAALHDPRCGISFAGKLLAGNCEAGQGKIGAPAPELLARGRALFDYSFIEADGSRMRPFKGWAEYEPVVPDYTHMTIAVVPVIPPGFRVSEETVHRLPLFCAISGASAGQELRPEHLASAIAHPQGLLAKAKGKIVLFFNQAENEAGREMAARTAHLLPASCLERIDLCAAGSALRDQAFALPIRAAGA